MRWAAQHCAGYERSALVVLHNRFGGGIVVVNGMMMVHGAVGGLEVARWDVEW